jgi:heme/copper-type cytochrome/quinol oxidase subunit 2
MHGPIPLAVIPHGGGPFDLSRFALVFKIMAGIAVLIVVTALVLWIWFSIKYRAGK